MPGHTFEMLRTAEPVDRFVFSAAYESDKQLPRKMMASKVVYNVTAYHVKSNAGHGKDEEVNVIWIVENPITSQSSSHTCFHLPVSNSSFR